MTRPRRAALPLLAALSFAALWACGPGLEHTEALCTAVTCMDPPPDACEHPGLLRSYAAEGSCVRSDGSCSYAFQTESCAHGCFDATRCRKPGDVLWHTARHEVGGFSTPRWLLASPEGGLLLVATLAVQAVQPGGADSWRFDMPEGARLSGAMVGDEGTTYLGGSTPHTPYPMLASWALTPNGELFWSWSGEIDDPALSPSAPALSQDGETIYLGADQVLYAISNEGNTSWRIDFAPLEVNPGDFRIAPLVDGIGDIYLTRSRRLFMAHVEILYAIDPAGSVRWQTDIWADENRTTTAQYADLIVGGGAHLYAGFRSGLVSHQKLDGSRDWLVAEDHAGVALEAMSNLVLSPDVGLVSALRAGDSADGDDRIYSVDAEGQLQQRSNIPAKMPNNLSPWALALTEGATVVICGFVEVEAGQVSMVVSEVGLDGRVLWKTILEGTEPSSSSSMRVMGPVIDDAGTIYLYNAEFGLYSLVGERRLAQHGWPATGGGNGRTNRFRR